MSNISMIQGIFGGTFDPIHFGHLNTAKSILQITGLQSILFIPAAMPLMRTKPCASAEHRLNMVRIATDCESNFLVDDREIRRQSFSYTFDTVNSLQEENSHTRYSLIFGLDTMLRLSEWDRWKDLLERIHIIVMQRPGWTFPDPLPYWWKVRKATCFDDIIRSKSGKIYMIDEAAEPIDISATCIRTRIKNGQNVDRLLPKKIWKYIQLNNLYNLKC